MELLRWLGLGGESEESKEKRMETLREEVLASPKLLGRILGKLDLPRQKGCRLTSTLWNGVICELFQKEDSKAQTIINGGSLLVKFRAMMEDESRKNVLGGPHPFHYISLYLLQDMRTEDSTWLRTNFKIKELTVGTNYVAASPENEKHAISLLKGTSSTLKRLCIPFLRNWEDNQDDDPPPNSKLHFPQLEVLRPNTSWCHTLQDAAPSAGEEAGFFTRIISASPRLKSLDHHCKGWPGFFEQPSVFSTIQKLELIALGTEPSLLRSENFGNLKELVWELLSFSEPPQVSQTLAQFSHCLQRLFITWGNDSEAKHPTNFPFCPALTHLEVGVLSVDSVNWENLPNLRYLRFKRIRDFQLSSEPDFKTCPSLKKVSYRGDRIGHSGNLSFHPTMIQFFSKLFQRFPNATDWKVQYKDVFQFCKAAAAAAAAQTSDNELHVRKFSVYSAGRHDNYGDEDMAYWMDRYVFSILPNLHELEELVLHNESGWDTQMRLSEIEFSKLTKLRRLKIYNYSNPEEKEVKAMEGIPEVCMVTSDRYGGSKPGETLLSAPNVVFRRVPYKNR